jgi:putative flippase GtrA
MNFDFKVDILKLLGGFSLVGIVTTVISLALIFVFLKLFHTPLIITYIGIYIATICLSFALNSLFVFRSEITIGKGIKYLAIYLSGMLLGTLLLWGLKKSLPFENYILGYMVIPFTMIWNFVFSYKVLKPVKTC